MEVNIYEKKKALLIAVILNSLIVISQIIFGVISNSSALIVDAVHNLQDVLSLVLAYIAAVFMVKEPTQRMTYGYLRAEVMSGFVNSLFLMGAIFVMIISSVEKLLNPQPINGVIVIVVGLIAFVVNSLSAFLLGFHHHHDHHHHEDLNIKAAYLHLLSDSLISLGVVIGGIAIYLFSIYWIDPLLAIVFSIYILKETYPVLKKTFFILMESVPVDISLVSVKKIIERFPEVKEIHDLHIWSLSSKDVYLTVHIKIDKENIKDIDLLIKKIENELRKIGINHITIQVETSNFNCENIY